MIRECVMCLIDIHHECDRWRWDDIAEILRPCECTHPTHTLTAEIDEWRRILDITEGPL